MLSIGELTVEQSRYYDCQFAQGRDDHYSGRGDSPALDRPRSRDAWVEARVVTGFMALMDGCDPGTGQRLKRVGRRSKVAALI